MPCWGKPVAQRKLTSCSPRSSCDVKSRQPTAATFPAACCFARMFELDSSVQAAADAGNRNLNRCPSCPRGARRATVGAGGNLRGGPQRPISPGSNLIGLNALPCVSIHFDGDGSLESNLPPTGTLTGRRREKALAHVWQ